jgi:2-keto-4-pentenoate hydratase/2-oxohepta-3-ene-1,7-dioic acid hydratase in catechol pathway
MKIVGFETDAGLRLGVIEEDQVIDLQAVDAKIPTDLGALLANTNGDLTAVRDLAARAPAAVRRPLQRLRFALPVAKPGKVVCLGLNYMDHVKEGPQRDNVPQYPSIFFRSLTSLVAHEGAIIRTRVTETLDYEGELAVIIGKRVKHLSVSEAAGCIAGFTCFNDASVREFQRRSTQWDMGKNFDRTGGFGPWMVTADELPPAGRGLKLETRLNGQVMQSDNTSNMLFPVAETLAYVTQGMTLEPGDVLVTGTPSGVGHARKPRVWMRHGDVCEVEIEGVGTLRNPVEDERA